MTQDKFPTPLRPSLDRRTALCGLGSTIALPWLTTLAQGADARSAGAEASQPMNGLLCSPHSFYDEGIDYVLDNVQEKAGTNAIVVYTYQGMTPGARGAQYLADHGKPIQPNRLNDATTWVNVDERYFRGTSLRHIEDGPNRLYADKNIVEDLEEPLRSRDMKLYARILEGWSMGYRPGFFKVHQIDLEGRLGDHTCYNHPDYQEFWVASTHNLFAQYKNLAGIFWGSERKSPLEDVLRGRVPTCFCEHCRKLGEQLGVDADGAAEGLRKMMEFVRGVREDGPPEEGSFVTFMRILIEYPDILGWEKVWRESYLSIPKQVRGAMKALNPQATLGWHGDHAVTGLGLFKRIGLDYGELTDTFDWIKPSVYHLAAAPRLRGRFTDLHETIFSDLKKDRALDLYFAINGYESEEEPEFDELAKAATEQGRLSENYVRREVGRAVKAVDGRAQIYAGPGIGIPGGPASKVERPELTYNDCVAAFEAGADGLIIGREYDEIPFPNMEAVGRAYREWVQG